MKTAGLHRFEEEGKRFAVDTETCFCFECDAVSWDVLEHYPEASVARLAHLLEGRYSQREIEEVVGELEWLRSCNSILPALSQEVLQKQFDVETGLHTFSLDWPLGSIRQVLPQALSMFLGRSGLQKNLRFQLRLPADFSPSPELLWACAEIFRAARLASKNMGLVLHTKVSAIRGIPAALAGQGLAIEWTVKEGEGETAVSGMAACLNVVWGKLAKTLQGTVVLCPRTGSFLEGVRELAKAGFPHIRLDMEGAYAGSPGIDPADFTAGLRATARFYAEELRCQHYFRLDPIAELFHQIYVGQPVRRRDPAGTNELAVDARGHVYPSRALCGIDAFDAGGLTESPLDERVLDPFEDLGSVTTPACIRCWARNLCGGGAAAVHHAYTGSFRHPHGPWCDAQRAWLANAVAAFSLLSAEGINFSRMIQGLTPAEKPSWRLLMRAAFRMHIGLRPIEEADAEWLTRWENWNEAAYFLLHESGLFLATQYDREMDSLHPPAYESEFVLVHKNSKPFGLIKIRPDRVPGVALLWLYFRNEADYASKSVRESFRFLLGETAGQQQLRRLLCPAGPGDTGLAQFLTAVGFREEGVLREALFLHGKHHDITLFSYTVPA